MGNTLHAIINLFGSQKAMAEACRVAPSAITAAKQQGRINDALKWRILVACREQGLTLDTTMLGLPPMAGEQRQQTPAGKAG